MKVFLKSITLFLLVFATLSASATPCFRVPTFQALKSSVNALYTRQLPNLHLSGAKSSLTEGLITMSREGAVEYPNAFHEYSLRMRFSPDGQYSRGHLVVSNSFRGGAGVGGGWAKFLDYQTMIEEIKRLEFEVLAPIDPSGARYLPDSVTHSSVSNQYLAPVMDAILSGPDTVISDGISFVDIFPDTPDFVQLTRYMTPAEAEGLGLPPTSTGHNGTQTIRFLKLLSAETGSPINIEKIRIERRNAASPINMIFDLTEID